MFSILEILIIVMMPALVALMVAVHAWASIAVKSLTLISVIFMGLLASVTCSLHFVYLAFGCIEVPHLPKMERRAPAARRVEVADDGSWDGLPPQ